VRYGLEEAFTASALQGLCQHHAALLVEGKIGYIAPELIAARATEIGRATAAAFEAAHREPEEHEAAPEPELAAMVETQTAPLDPPPPPEPLAPPAPAETETKKAKK